MNTLRRDIKERTNQIVYQRSSVQVFVSLNNKTSLSSVRSKMQWSLYLLILMGQCCFFTCRLYEYHFIKENKSWSEAQRYCREKYTDLAKVFDMTDMSRLRNATQNQGEAWIGLNNNTDGNRTWHWSLPGVEYIQNDSSWNQSGRTQHEQLGNCGRKRYDKGDKKLAGISCDTRWWFICYDEMKKMNERFHLITDQINWTQAQNYCRSYYTDLASGLDQVDGEEMKALMKSKNSEFTAWVGLFRDSWRWSDGSDFSFRYWDMELFNDKQSNKTCAMTLLNRSGKWSSDECDNKKPFFCYDAEFYNNLILVGENKTWEEALYYCRENYNDLVSITNSREQNWIQEKVKEANSTYVWLGLRYTCTLGFWFWVIDEVVEYKNWDSDVTTDDCNMSGAMNAESPHEWSKQADNKMFNFICSKK